MRGRLRLAWTLMCGNCLRRLTVGSRTESQNGARANAKDAGWVFHRRLGWVCSRCAEELAGRDRK
jgi:hypothetical protein